MHRLPRILLIALLVLVPAVSCQLAISETQPPPPPNPAKAPPPPPPPARLKIVDMMAWAPLKRHHRTYGAEPGINVTTYAFDRDMDGYFDDARYFRQEFTKLVPAGFTGLVSLDWEHTITKWLKKPPDSPEFRRAVRHLKDLLILAKQLRPRAQISYFGLPLHQYWRREDGWRERSLAMAEFLRYADWIGPCIYQFYMTEDQQPAQRQQDFVTANIEVALEVARLAGGKPVYAWINHRYHPSNEKHPFVEVVESDFRENLRSILSVRHRGKSVDGIILWGADAYYQRKGQLKITGDANATLDDVARRYLRWTAEELGKVPRRREDEE